MKVRTVSAATLFAVLLMVSSASANQVVGAPLQPTSGTVSVRQTGRTVNAARAARQDVCETGMTKYPPISRELYDQLRQVPASYDGDLEYRPCAVALDDGRELSCVYIVDQKPYIRMWGVYPADDRGKLSVSISSVRRIADSPSRLPARLANELYRAGESGMGYTVFTVEFTSGASRAYVTGNAVDFIEPPPGLRASDAVAVRPHEGRQEAESQSIDYYWCLYDGVESVG